MPRPTPNWQPLSMVPTLAKLVAAQLEEVTTQLQRRREAQKQPHVLDDHTVSRVLKLYGEQQEFMWVYEAQVERWQKETLNPTQLQQIKPKLSKIIEIAEDLKGKTIESILGKSDVELALDVLSGKIPPPY